MQILIIEDEQAAARRLEKMILEAQPDVTVLAHLDRVETAVDWLRQNPAPDLIFLDIHLADGSSFEIFEHVEVMVPIIFTTAYDEYAVQAFKVNAVDYLLKPVKSGELANALNKYKQIHEKPDFSSLLGTMRQREGSYLRRMLIKLGTSIKLVDMNDVSFFYTKDKISFLVTRSTGKRWPVDYPLDRLEQLLDPSVFFRINRQYIVHLEGIKEMQPYSKSRVKILLEHGTEQDIVVSTERSSQFKKWLIGTNTLE
jgi:two-component system, LytTR family, response regulator LytT